MLLHWQRSASSLWYPWLTIRVFSNTYLCMPLLTVTSGAMSGQSQANRECQRAKGSKFPDSSRSCLFLCLSQSYGSCRTERLSLRRITLRVVSPSHRHICWQGRREGSSHSGTGFRQQGLSGTRFFTCDISWHCELTHEAGN